MKRFLAIFLSLCMASSLVACGGSGGSGGSKSEAASGDTSGTSAPAASGSSEAPPVPSGEKVKLAFWSPFSGGDGDIMKAMVKDYNAQSTVAEVEFLIFKSEEYYTKLLTSLTSDTAPDVAISHASRILEFSNDGLIEPLDDLAAGAGLRWDEFSGALDAATQIEGKHYAVPLDTHLLLMHFNLDLLREAGMIGEDGKPSMQPGEQGFFDYFNEVQSKLPSGVMPISGTSSFGLPQYLWYTLLTQHGGEIQSADGKTATLDTPENKQALTIMKKMVDTNLWPKNQKNGGEIFTARKASATINGNWGIPTFEKISGLNFISLPFPQFTDTKSVYADSHTLVMPRQKQADPNKQAAVMDFMNWMANNTAAWAQAGHVPSKTAVVESAEFQALPYRSEYAKSAEYAHFYPKSLCITGMIELVQRELATMIAGEQDVDTTAKNMQEGYQKLLDAQN